MSANACVIKTAAGEVGVTETPVNTGPRVKAYQAATELAGSGWPWCSAFVEWVWERCRVDTRICSPSTQVFADRARAAGMAVPWRKCVPGAAVCWDGRHVEIAIAPASSDGRVWACIGGNVSDAVRRTTRDITGATIIVPPELNGGDIRARQYWFEDPGAKASQRLLGPWRGKLGLAKARRVAKSRPRWQQPRVKRVGKDRFGVLIGERSIYGPFGDKDYRDKALRIIAKRTGRTLRPYSTPAPVAGMPAESLGKTD